MFWSGNYIAVRELNSLLKEENVTLSQVLEADDILQECTADNKSLIQFLTRSEILAELIKLVTEEPPKNDDLASQYRHANLASEVLSSRLSTLSDRLSSETALMHRLCNFLDKDPPLNPLLASYFSKTIEMLLDRSIKQDCYLYHIVCLRVLDFFVSRRDFLPNLLRHISTSAIADIFKCFIRLDDDFSKTILEWLDCNQFLDNLIQIICGTYVPEPRVTTEEHNMSSEDKQSNKHEECGDRLEVNHKEDGAKEESHIVNDIVAENEKVSVSQIHDEMSEGDKESEEREALQRAERMRAVASANAVDLLGDLILTSEDTNSIRSETQSVLLRRLESEPYIRMLLQTIFTSPTSSRRYAIVNGCRLLSMLLQQQPINRESQNCDEYRSNMEVTVAPHIPLLHQALLQPPEETLEGGVGLARLEVASLLARLVASSVPEVPAAILTLGTPGLLLDMFFKHQNNNFLHARVYALIKTALGNQLYRMEYAKHLFVECNLITRLLDVYEENEHPERRGKARASLMGYVILLLRYIEHWVNLEYTCSNIKGELFAGREAEIEHFLNFTVKKLAPVLMQHDTPLGGFYPNAHTYEESMDSLQVTYEIENISAQLDAPYELTSANVEDGSAAVDRTNSSYEEAERIQKAGFVAFFDLVKQRGLEDAVWEDEDPAEFGSESETAKHVYKDMAENTSPWGFSGVQSASASDESWAQFGAAFGDAQEDEKNSGTTRSAGEIFSDNDFGPWDSFANTGLPEADDNAQTDLVQSMQNLSLQSDLPNNQLDDFTAELANNLRTAMSSMSHEAIASIINANLTLPPAVIPAQLSGDDLETSAPEDSVQSTEKTLSSGSDASVLLDEDISEENKEKNSER